MRPLTLPTVRLSCSPELDRPEQLITHSALNSRHYLAKDFCNHQKKVVDKTMVSRHSFRHFQAVRDMMIDPTIKK